MFLFLLESLFLFHNVISYLCEHVNNIYLFIRFNTFFTLGSLCFLQVAFSLLAYLSICFNY